MIRLRIAEMLARAQALLGHRDPGRALDEFVWFAAESCRRDRALFEGIERCDAFPEVCDARQELRDAVDELIRRARRAGAIRRELDSRDLGALVGAAMEAARHAGRPDAWRRYVRVLLAGLRP